ncbi:MAG: sulfotransferase domain-containing protein [Nitrososphaera sp.]|nr:sulfotransferase domain-containing protein [Nitrososphaera sp.]
MSNLLEKSKKITPSAIKKLLPTKIKQDAISSLTAFSVWHQTFNADSRSLPDFIIAGTQKGGTTALYSLLSHHPNITPALVKEIHYFDWHYSRGLKWYKAHFPIINNKSMRSSRDNCPFITGEASPYYMFYPYAFERIAKIVPHVRLIFLLRDPVERTYSSYHQQRHMGREVHSFEEALDLEKGRIEPEVDKILRDETYVSYNHAHFSYLARGIYADQIKRCFEFFPRNNVLIIDSGRFFKHTSEVYGEVSNFLGLTAHAIPKIYTSNIRNYDKMNADTRRRLVDYFRPHNERLFDLIGERFDWSI